MDVPDRKSLVYSISLQTRQIAATNHYFKNPASISWLLLQGQNFVKKTCFPNLKSLMNHRLTDRKELKGVLSLEKDFKTLKDMIVDTTGAYPFELFKVKVDEVVASIIWAFYPTTGVSR